MVVVELRVLLFANNLSNHRVAHSHLQRKFSRNRNFFRLGLDPKSGNWDEVRW